MISIRSIVTASVSTLVLAFAVGCGSGSEGTVDGSEIKTDVDQSATYATANTSSRSAATYNGYYYQGYTVGPSDPCPEASSCECLTYLGNCVEACPYKNMMIYDGKCVYPADGVAPDSQTSSCSAGYYLCWSNVQQKSVCTTRKCY
ncbi:MAG: hypothetical protein JWM74_3720 [Myxococcaceae bacterium]|jgi:hypothetical protein|nr:hypothetical protein [Myxococcaceae bacterium]